MNALARLIIRLVALVVAACILLLYLRVEIYDWPEARPFSGAQWYNPYDGVLINTPLRANFHAHTKSWLGVTFGENSEAEMVGAYSDRGYDIIGISNYHSISTYFDTSSLYIPVYEHGLNLLKVHNLPLGAREVLFPAFPLHLSMHQTQQMLNRTARISELNALCHPTMSWISPRKMDRLTGYSLLEVGNTLGMSLEHWDAALSAGRLVWILSNDDTHDLIREPTFIKWNMIYAEGRLAGAAIAAMRRGAHYGVESYRGDCENTALKRCEIRGDSLFIDMDDVVNRIDLYGQEGIMLKSVVRQSSIAYPFAQHDAYVRAEIHMDECVYYLNPIVRTESGIPPVASALSSKIDQSSTWGIRMLLVVVLIWVGYGIYRTVTDHRTA